MEPGMEPPTERTTRRPRTLVLCFDGTTNQYSQKNTNVIKLFGALLKQSIDTDRLPLDQAVYYQPGIGTYGPVGSSWLALQLDKAFAIYLQEHVLGGYKFLMQTYQPGDKIVMFGFSRGAYTAMALAEMLCHVGLLPANNEDHAAFAYKEFVSLDRKIAGHSDPIAKRRAKTAKRRAKIAKRRAKISLHRAKMTRVRAKLASDRHKLARVRHKFAAVLGKATTVLGKAITVLGKATSVLGKAKPLPRIKRRIAATMRRKIWKKEGDPGKVTKGHTSFKELFSRDIKIEFIGLWDAVDSVGFIPRRFYLTTNNPKVLHLRHAIALQERRVKFQPTLWNNINSEGNADYWPLTGSSVRQVWFAGGHGDVGGGNTDATDDCALSHIPLRWMIREAIAHVPTIRWDLGVLEKMGIKAHYRISHSEDSYLLQKAMERFKKDAAASALFAWTRPTASIMGVIWWHLLEVCPRPRSGPHSWKRPHLLSHRPLRHSSAPRGHELMIHASVLERVRDEMSREAKVSQTADMSQSPTYRLLQKRLAELADPYCIWVADSWLLSGGQKLIEAMESGVHELGLRRHLFLQPGKKFWPLYDGIEEDYSIELSQQGLLLPDNNLCPPYKEIERRHALELSGEPQSDNEKPGSKATPRALWTLPIKEIEAYTRPPKIWQSFNL